jgi:predicted transposase YbfD/YdcC
MHHLSIVPDFRQAWKVQHQLSDILFLTVCAVICGAEGWDEIQGKRMKNRSTTGLVALYQ